VKRSGRRRGQRGGSQDDGGMRKAVGVAAARARRGAVGEGGDTKGGALSGRREACCRDARRAVPIAP
jgi:hypothetical protein